MKASSWPWALVGFAVLGLSCRGEPASVPPVPDATADRSPGPPERSTNGWPAEPGWHRLSQVELHGFPTALAFEPQGDALWLAGPYRRRLVRIAAGPAPRLELALPPERQVKSLVGGPAMGEVTVLDASGRRLLRASAKGFLALDFPVADPSKRAAALVATGGGGFQLQDAVGRPLGSSVPEALRGLPLPDGSALRAVVGALPLLVRTEATGEVHRVAVSQIPKARRVEVVGRGTEGPIWLLAEVEGEPSGSRRPERHLVAVDESGRVLERTRPPAIDDRRGAAGPGKGTGAGQAAVDKRGRLAWAAAGPGGIEVWLFVPGTGRKGPQILGVLPTERSPLPPSGGSGSLAGSDAPGAVAGTEER